MKRIILCIFIFKTIISFSQTSIFDKKLDSIINKPIDFNNVNYKALNYAIYLKTNEVRKINKLPTLQYNVLLEEMAMLHSKDMVTKNFFSHENPFDKKRKTILDRAYYVGIKNPNIAENIAESFGLQYKPNTKIYLRGKGKFSYTPDGDLIQPHTYKSLAEQVVNTWLDSPGHRKNLLNPSAIQIGCGCSLFYDSTFNFMPSFKITQNFQLYEAIKEK